ncbi:pantetheine-phosphate adenylyltransferase [Myxococcus sp. RHSTA-1-4]|uniref:pantetheine-phosphate adenylyltransferase n=1 Tax=Myxococcus sp. RHSTA-1-4 TaxID=2874601 RepID=UPI001CBD22B5|nr:pantetheine-phosphate adenylyltransferase [Myxococcus sp. RHSTA-1-4]MBZ4421470.1 pantetheine-phosphate adenylyltransferase [Myxococcus sp. RHSTA-1-4]
MPVAIYPGSFDPLTNGHLSLIQRSLKMFDRLIVAIAVNPKKTPLFTEDERRQLIRDACGNDPRVEVDAFHGLLVDYVKRRNAGVIVRGLRAVSDFEYEFQLANMNRKLAPDIETVFMMTGEDYFYISSQLVREVASFGGDVTGLVPDNVHQKLKAKFAGRK